MVAKATVQDHVGFSAQVLVDSVVQTDAAKVVAWIVQLPVKGVVIHFATMTALHVVRDNVLAAPDPAVDIAEMVVAAAVMARQGYSDGQD